MTESTRPEQAKSTEPAQVDSVISKLAERIAATPAVEPAKVTEAEQRRAELEIRHRYRSLIGEIGRRYADCTLESFDCTSADAAAARRKIAGMLSDLDRCISVGKNLLLYGPVGTGKDHLMAAAMLHAVLGGHEVRWVNGLDLFGHMRDRIGADESERAMIGQLTAAEVLAISDPLSEGAELSDFQRQTLFRVVDRRYRDLKPTWVTVNVANGEEFAKRTSPAIYDRLRENALAVPCNWPSFRGRKTAASPA